MVKTKTLRPFSKKAIVSETPQWAKWMFRTVYLATKVSIGYIAATNIFTPDQKYEITIFLTLVIDPFFFGLSKMFGVEVKDGK